MKKNLNIFVNEKLLLFLFELICFSGQRYQPDLESYFQNPSKWGKR